MTEPLRELFGPGGALSRALPAYEPRAPQLAMAASVERALAHGRALVVEAGTGTGKTLAYLLPAARSGLKVVVSTATKTLQEQLAEKDVPLLRALGVDAKVAFLKGRQNYLCLLRFEQFHRNPTFAVRGEAAVFDGIARWAETTQTGDRAELSDLPERLQGHVQVAQRAPETIVLQVEQHSGSPIDPASIAALGTDVFGTAWEVKVIEVKGLHRLPSGKLPYFLPMRAQE